MYYGCSIKPSPPKSPLHVYALQTNTLVLAIEYDDVCGNFQHAENKCVIWLEFTNKKSQQIAPMCWTNNLNPLTICIHV